MEHEHKAVLFVCNKYPMLNIHYKKDTAIIVNGEVIRQAMEHIGFIRTPYGGHYETNDPEKIKYLRNCPQYKEGLIVEVENIEKMRENPLQPEAHPVTQGGIGTAAREVVAAVPVAAAAPAPVAAAVGPGHKRKAF